MLIAAAECGEGGVEGASANVELIHEFCGGFSDGAPVHEAAIGEGVAAMFFENDVLGDPHGADQAFAFAVVGDVGDAEIGALSGVELREIGFTEKYLAAICFTQTNGDLGQFLLAVSIDAGDAEDFVAHG